MPFSSYLASSLLNWHRGVSMLPPPPSVHIGLHSGNPGASGLLNDVTVGVAEGRATIPVSSWREPVKTEGSDTVSYTISNDAAVVFTESAGATTLVSHFSCWDSATGGNFLGYGLIAGALTIVAGDPVRFLPGALKIRVLTLQALANDGQLSTALFTFTQEPSTVAGGDAIYNLGYHFTVDTGLQLTKVGIFNTGVAKDHSVGIWNFTNPVTPELVWSASLLAVDPCDSDAFYCWRSIPFGPILRKDVDYVVSAAWDTADAVPAIVDIETISVAPGVQLNHPAASHIGQEYALPSLLANQSSYPPVEQPVDYAFGFYTVNLALGVYKPAPD